MRYIIFTLFIIFLAGVYSFSFQKRNESIQPTTAITTLVAEADPAGIESPVVYTGAFSVDPQQFVAFAKKFIGTPYRYGSMNPEIGFDCSGFINYVAKHFELKVPRSSVQFTNLGKEVQPAEALAGDFILFTGTDTTKRVVGHMGIVTENSDSGLEFIHSSSGKGKGVITSPMTGYYQTRFVKIIRIFPLGHDKIIT